MLTIIRRLAGAALLTLGTVVFTVLILPKFFGWSSYVVTSGSMAPTFNVGSVVVAAPTTPGAVAVKDVVVFRDPDGFTTHRIVGMTSKAAGRNTTTTLVTQGDANEDADPTPLDPRNVVGKARFAVPHLGYVVNSVRSPVGAGALAALALFVLFSSGSRPGRQLDTSNATEREAVLAT